VNLRGALERANEPHVILARFECSNAQHIRRVAKPTVGAESREPARRVDRRLRVRSRQERDVDVTRGIAVEAAEVPLRRVGNRHDPVGATRQPSEPAFVVEAVQQRVVIREEARRQIEHGGNHGNAPAARKAAIAAVKDIHVSNQFLDWSLPRSPVGATPRQHGVIGHGELDLDTFSLKRLEHRVCFRVTPLLVEQQKIQGLVVCQQRLDEASKVQRDADVNAEGQATHVYGHFHDRWTSGRPAS